jgi:hypothetical protein
MVVTFELIDAAALSNVVGGFDWSRFARAVGGGALTGGMGGAVSGAITGSAVAGIGAPFGAAVSATVGALGGAVVAGIRNVIEQRP